MPAASSLSERVFSVAGNVVTPKRAKLNPEKVEDLGGELQQLLSFGLDPFLVSLQSEDFMSGRLENNRI